MKTRVASIRATRKGQRMTHPTKGYPMGGPGRDGRARYRIYREVRSDGVEWSCTCGSWRFAKRDRNGRKPACKHMKWLFNGYLPSTNRDVMLSRECIDLGLLNAQVIAKYEGVQ